MMKRILGLTFTFILASISPVLSQDIAPEGATGHTHKTSVSADSYMISAANPLAAQAGYDVLKEGGSAVDAMVATQMVLGLVEPQSSGLGGGAFLVYHDAKTGKPTTLDGRETAPMAATPDLFLKPDGTPMKFFDAVVGGRSVGTPGTVKLMYEAHQRYGKLDWVRLLQPAIDLATDGFKVSPRLAKLIAKDQKRLSTSATTRAYFFDQMGSPLPAGTVLKNPTYADTLRQIAKYGADAFYQGPIAQDIVTAVRGASNPGLLNLDDLANYQVIERSPTCMMYKDHRICGMGPPSSGGLTVGQILGMVQSFDLKKPTAQAFHIIAEASRLAFADRGLYMADDDFVIMPEGLLNDNYLKHRARLINPDKAATDAQPGIPPWSQATALSPDNSIELPSTSHMSIIDADGNAVSLTTTIENGFGSRVMVRGFLLNNELTDFSFVPEKNGYLVANRLQPGKRPRSSMAPTIIYGPDDKLKMVVGSPGGSRIIGYVAQTIIGVLDWNMDVQDAISMPHVVKRFGTLDIETGADDLASELESFGHKVKVRDLNSGLHAIVRNDDAWVGGADPRREGIVMGK
ncbi:MAG: gamma-glutamyltransferase [Magnetovibrio sp.]|nr:gamma-glutamyltransferase [Magnetovibrio sp.]